MPHPSLRSMHQTAVLWEKTGDDYEGEPKVSLPVVVKCRWEDRKSQMVNTEGVVIGLDASVKVARDIPIDSLMRLGDLSSITGTGFTDDPDDVDVYQVKTMNRVPSLNNRARTRRYGLVRFRGALPENVG